ncbi:MAG: preprotein translocase subunit SecE [Chloroflexaceae bacterium]|nr:preprotein translocase subunit SecE [Chloroflexaceae bacterium]
MAVANAKDKGKERQEHAFVRVVHDTRAELRKVVWPNRKEAIRLTVVVIIISVAIGVFLFAGDTLFLWLYIWLESLTG